MPFMSQDYLLHISDEKRDQVFRTNAQLGYQPETSDSLLLPDKDRYAGTYVLGVQGVGKSGLLENLIAFDAQAGNAVIVIDPHGDLTMNCLAALPSHLLAQTYLVDMEDEAYPFGVNVFATSKLESSIALARAVDRILHIFEVLWPDVLSQQHLPRYVRAATIALLCCPGSTLVDVYMFLLDDQVRTRMLQHVTDPTVRQFWQTQYDDLSAAERLRRVQPLIGRLESLFMGRSLVRNIVGQRKTTITFRKAIEERAILFLRLPIKTVAQDARLIGTILLSQIHAAVFSFANVPEAQRPGVSLYLDEFQHFTTPDITELFTEGRKFGVKLTVAHQFRGQLPKYLQEATMTARTTICFQTIPEDARDMASIFPAQETTIRPEDIEPHPVNHVLTYGSDKPILREFIEQYLRPLQSQKRGGKVDINGTHLTYDVWHGAKMREVYVADPTPYLDNLLYEVMRTGNPELPIPYEAMIGFANCGRGFYTQGRMVSGDMLGPQANFPSALVVQSGEGFRWTRAPESGREQLYHFLFHLRMTMIALAEEPIGKRTAPSTTVVAGMLTQLPRRAAFVRTGETVGVIYTNDTPQRLSGRELVARVQTVLEQTRAKYCHPRAEVEQVPTQPDEVVEGVPNESPVAPRLVEPDERPTPPSTPTPPTTRWEERDQ